MTKIADLAALSGTPADGDLFHIVDVSDTTMSPEGTNKTITWSDIKRHFASRSDLVTWAGANTAPDGTVVSDGTVQYVASSGATAISDLGGWLPFGDVYVEHFGAVSDLNLSTGAGTDNSSAIQAAADWCASQKLTMNFQKAGLYKLSSQIEVNANHVYWDTPGAMWSDRATLGVYAGTGDDSVLIRPENATTPATGQLLNVSISNIILYRVQAGSTAGGFRLQRCATVLFQNVSSWGHYRNYWFQSCQNLDMFKCTGSAVNFTNSSGSANIFIGGLTLTDSSIAHTSVHRIYDWLGGTDEHDAQIHIAHNDYTLISNGYYGLFDNAKYGLLIKPESSSSHILSTIIDGAQFDGGTSPTTFTGIRFDNTAGGNIQFTQMRGGYIGQMGSGVVFDSGGAQYGQVFLLGVLFPNSAKQAVLAAPGTGTDLKLVLQNCIIRHWGVAGTATTSPDNLAVYIGRADTVKVAGCHFNVLSTNKPLFYTTNCAVVELLYNYATGVHSNLTYASVTKLKCIGNESDISGGFPDRFLPVIAEYADDAAAASGGVLVGEYYRTGSVLKVRVS